MSDLPVHWFADMEVSTIQPKTIAALKVPTILYITKDVCKPTSAHYMATSFSFVDIVPGYKTQTNQLLAWITIFSH